MPFHILPPIDAPFYFNKLIRSIIYKASIQSMFSIRLFISAQLSALSMMAERQDLNVHQSVEWLIHSVYDGPFVQWVIANDTFAFNGQSKTTDDTMEPMSFGRIQINSLGIPKAELYFTHGWQQKKKKRTNRTSPQSEGLSDLWLRTKPSRLL